MTTSILRRTAAALALTLAVGTPALAIAGSADAVTSTRAAQAAAKQEPTRLRVVTSGRVVDKDTGTATVSGWLTRSGAAYPGQTVLLKSKPGTRAGHHRRWGVADSAVTGPDGTVTFTVSPTVRTLYRLAFPQNADARSAHSHVVVISSLVETRLPVRAARTRTGDLHVGGRLKANGHGLAWRRVVLQTQEGGSAEWTRVKAKRTHRHGRVLFLVDDPTDGAHYRLYFPGGGRFRSATSLTVTA